MSDTTTAKSNPERRSTGSKRTGSAASSSKSRNARTSRYATCLEAGFDLTKGKKYRVVPDSEEEAKGLLRVVDDSGEDYLYLASRFKLEA